MYIGVPTYAYCAGSNVFDQTSLLLKYEHKQLSRIKLGTLVMQYLTAARRPIKYLTSNSASVLSLHLIPFVSRSCPCNGGLPSLIIRFTLLNPRPNNYSVVSRISEGVHSNPSVRCYCPKQAV